ncbi:MAG TPA: guanylate kinase [Polyangiales bacterium]|jgi:guanylate kinase|nr:guanylate kinase [Polyangiales bacterium]
MVNDLLLLIISSPSGAGKTTLTRDLLAYFSDMTFSVSHTTRKPRATEQNGHDYHFVSRHEFDDLVKRQEFVEWAEVHGNFYGTAVAEISRADREQRRGIVFDVDYQGARQIRAVRADAISVFVLPPSMDELKRRLRARASDDESTIERRFKNARAEIEHYGLFDYVIVNDELEQAKLRLRSIVEAERARRSRMARHAEELLRQSRVLRCALPARALAADGGGGASGRCLRSDLLARRAGPNDRRDQTRGRDLALRHQRRHPPPRRALRRHEHRPDRPPSADRCRTFCRHQLRRPRESNAERRVA